MISSGVVAAVVGMFQLIAARYTNRILDRLERVMSIKKNEKTK